MEFNAEDVSGESVVKVTHSDGSVDCTRGEPGSRDTIDPRTLSFEGLLGAPIELPPDTVLATMIVLLPLMIRSRF